MKCFVFRKEGQAVCVSDRASIPNECYPIVEVDIPEEGSGLGDMPEGVTVTQHLSEGAQYTAVWSQREVFNSAGVERAKIIVRIPAPQCKNTVVITQHLEHVQHPGYKLKQKLIEMAAAFDKKHGHVAAKLRLTVEDETILRQFTVLENSTYFGTIETPVRPYGLFGYSVVYNAETTEFTE